LGVGWLDEDHATQHKTQHADRRGGIGSGVRTRRRGVVAPAPPSDEARGPAVTHRTVKRSDGDVG
jgi:hypothetical protein